MALQKSVVNLHHDCYLLHFLLLRKRMLELEKNSKDAGLSDFVSLEMDN